MKNQNIKVWFSWQISQNLLPPGLIKIPLRVEFLLYHPESIKSIFQVSPDSLKHVLHQQLRKYRRFYCFYSLVFTFFCYTIFFNMSSTKQKVYFSVTSREQHGPQDWTCSYDLLTRKYYIKIISCFSFSSVEVIDFKNQCVYKMSLVPLNIQIMINLWD